jgi:hypothetical protein
MYTSRSHVLSLSRCPTAGLCIVCRSMYARVACERMSRSFNNHHIAGQVQYLQSCRNRQRDSQISHPNKSAFLTRTVYKSCSDLGRDNRLHFFGSNCEIGRYVAKPLHSNAEYGPQDLYNNWRHEACEAGPLDSLGESTSRRLTPASTTRLLHRRRQGREPGIHAGESVWIALPLFAYV